MSPIVVITPDVAPKKSPVLAPLLSISLITHRLRSYLEQIQVYFSRIGQQSQAVFERESRPLQQQAEPVAPVAVHGHVSQVLLRIGNGSYTLVTDVAEKRIIVQQIHDEFCIIE
jgi:hypothetical protein